MKDRALLSPTEIAALLQELAFSPEIITLLHAAARSLEADRAAGEKFRIFAARWPEEAPLPDPEFSNSLWLCLVVAQAFPDTIARQAALGISPQITAETLRDLQRKLLEYRERTGRWGLDYRHLAWMRSHVTSNLYAIGRLQYQRGFYREVFNIYRLPDGRACALAKNGLECSSDGWPVQTGATFHTSLQEEDAPSGHEPDPHSGAICQTQTHLPPRTIRILGEKEPVLHVHIPSGSKLDPAACLASLRAAKNFFSRQFPESGYRAICCRTWLLDRNLENVLPPGSNILAFGQLFHPLAIPNADNSQHIQRIFGDKEADWRNLTPHTRLQMAAKTYLEKGGLFRLTSGYLLWDDPLLA